MRKFTLLLFFVLALLTNTTCGQEKTEARTSPKERVFEEDRLSTIKDSVCITGTVTLVYAELDGDYHIRIKMDSNDIKLSHRNYTKQDSCIVVEVVCAHQAIYPIAACTCEGYYNSIPIPKVGEHVRVSGPLVFDRIHRWTEIHPVLSLDEEEYTVER